MSHPALIPNNIAVITGAGAGGIGFATCQHLLTHYSMKVILIDNSSSTLSESSSILSKSGIPQDKFECRLVDVTDFKAVLELKEYVYGTYGRVDFLFANAGVGIDSKDFKEGGDVESWRKILEVNLFGVLNCTQAFVQSMVDQDSPAIVVITGSKQGITQPPGNPAYNVSKSAIKSLSESLSHSLLSTKVTVNLLIPGYTFTKLTTKIGDKVPDLEKKPEAAWTPDQVAEELFKRLKNEFYIVCPDNDVSYELDFARMEWSANDILQKRPPLSRWHPDYKEEFAKFIESKVGKK